MRAFHYQQKLKLVGLGLVIENVHFVRSAPGFEDKKEFIETSLIEKLCKELSIVNYRGTVRFSGFVEPLLDKNIYNLLSLIKKYLSSNLEMVTNGDVLNLKRLKKLFLMA